MNEVLRAGLMEKDNVFKINIISVGFSLLDNYKSKRRDKTLTKLFLKNFMTIFVDYPAIPLTPLVGPYFQ
jgi:hypothetical protein